MESYHSDDESYPEMKHCYIRSWEHYRDLGFQISRSADASGDDGYQIDQLRLDSPAAHTFIRKNDHLIEVNNINVEKASHQYLYSLVFDSYDRDGHVSLLLIDDDGYQWYKRNRIRIDPTSPHANITRHKTPKNQAIFTSGDTSDASLSTTDTPNKNKSDQNRKTMPWKTFSPATKNNRSTGDVSIESVLSASKSTSPTEDIRLCTIYKADQQDTWGVELNYHRKELFHSITTLSGRNNGPSNAQLAGIKNNDRLIEINGVNVQGLDHEQVTTLIRAIKYPQPSQLLVADEPTFVLYKQQQRTIHQTLPNVKIVAPNTVVASPSTPPSTPTISIGRRMLIASPISKNGEETSNPNQRFFDIQDEHQRMLLQLEGYEDMPLLPLEQAVERLEEIVPKIIRNAWIAKERSTDVADGLTQDESACIQLYTMEWKPSNRSLYRHLNATLRAEDRDQLVPYFCYLKLVLTALWKLPLVRRTVWRGVKADLSAQYPVGKEFVWWGFSSCTESLDLLESDKFLGKTGVRTLFSVECEAGKSISAHSYYKTENEILLLPATQLRVITRMNSGNGLHIVHLREIKGRFSLLQEPFT